MRALTILLLLCATSTVARTARAQHVPRWTAEVSVGSGAHPRHVGNLYFEGARTGTAWFAASASVEMRQGVAVYLQGELSPDLTLGHNLVCTVTPTGGCESSFDDRGGQGGTVGVRVAPIQRI